MQLDKTRIAIRERGYLDLLDISLQVTRHYMGPLLASTMVFAIPLMLVNWWLIGWIIDEEFTAESRFYYLWIQCLLVFIEAPLASLLTTLYLGSTMFMATPSWRELLADLLKNLPRLFVSLFVIRGIMLAWILAFSLDPATADISPAAVFLPMLAVYVAILRGVRPFINEIILLERSPMHSKSPNVITIRRRSAMLHNPSAGDLFGRFMASVPAAVTLTIVLAGSLWFIIGTATNDWMWGPVILHLCIPLAMWLVVGFFSVVRFLNYLDLRIRREGWETELLVRAAAVAYAD